MSMGSLPETTDAARPLMCDSTIGRPSCSVRLSLVEPPTVGDRGRVGHVETSAAGRLCAAASSAGVA